MKLTFPELSLVLLIGPSGAGKSTFARKHFRPTEVVSSDFCRGLVTDDENDQSASEGAFVVLRAIVTERLKLGKFTVVDATNVDKQHRSELIGLARSYHVLPGAIVFKLRESVCFARNRERPDRQFGIHVIKRQLAMMRRGLRGLKREGFRHIYTLSSDEEVDDVEAVEREPLWNDRRTETGPFDVIGDVHGCAEELQELLGRLGYEVDQDSRLATHPEGRRLVFVGDLIDRGPNSPEVLRFVMANVAERSAFCVVGNHDAKLLKYLRGKKVRLTHGLEETVGQLEHDPIDKRDLADFLYGLISHFVFDHGRLVVAHAGIKEEMQGRGSGAVREFCMYGDTTGERDEFGLPVRLDWAAKYRGEALVIYGHTPFENPRWLNNTVNIDTGCAFGGTLTALRYPEQETVSVPARKKYAEPARPLREDSDTDKLTAQQKHDSILDFGDLLEKRFINTRYRPNITLRSENAAAALEIMSRFAVDPRWLIYLPPTMSPGETSDESGWLERPEEALRYFADRGVSRVICEEKHMGSRAIVVLCRTPKIAVTRFGFETPSPGEIFTRTGRPFFQEVELTARVLERLNAAIESAGLWEELQTDWLCLDCELMPWSVKAQELLRRQYAAVGASGTAFFEGAAGLFEEALAGTNALEEEAVETLRSLRSTYRSGSDHFACYLEAYRAYCWETDGVEGIRLAPFQILAGEGTVYSSGRYDHRWHMELVAKLCSADDSGLLQETRWLEVDPTSEGRIREAVQWWEEMTSSGGEGMVVKPPFPLTRDEKGRIIQPGIKCRGREYLRIIYGPTYVDPDRLDRLKNRNLKHKRSMAEREFLLGLEALERFVEHQPLNAVHECVFAVLAMESEPVDPRL